MNNIIYIILFVISILIAGFSQILLKKGSGLKKIYLNKFTIFGYGIMIISTLLTLIAYSKVNLSLGVLLQSLSFVFVPLLSYIFLKEKINKNYITGVFFIFLGVIVFSI